MDTKFNGMQGSISHTYNVMPGRKWEYPIPALSFSYCDPQSETYITHTSDELIVDVDSGPLAGNNPNAISGINKQPVNIDGSQFRFIKLKTNLKSVDEKGFFNSAGFWTALVLPLAVIPLFILFG